MFEQAYDTKIDFCSPDEIREFQFKRLQKVINYVYARSIFYRDKFKKANLVPEDIKTLNDIRKIPITTKEDLRIRNWDFVCVPRESWADMFVTSGVTGKQIYFPLTKGDIEENAKQQAKFWQTLGVRKEDMVQLTLPMGSAMWCAGLLWWLGNFVNGTCVLRFGPGRTGAQIRNMRLLKPTILCGTSSFLIKLGFAASSCLEEIKPRLLICTGENILSEDLKKNALGRRLSEAWGGIPIRSVYGSTEGARCCECETGQGYHTLPEVGFIEIVDPVTYKVLKPGETGMLLFTRFSIEGLPLLRYAIGDITFMIDEKCGCGRNTPRIGPILGRVDDRMKINGVNVFPSAVEEIVLRIPQVSQYYLEVYMSDNFRDKLRVYISSDQVEYERVPGKLSAIVEEKIRSMLGVRVEVIFQKLDEILRKVMPHGTIKPLKFFDLRKKMG